MKFTCHSFIQRKGADALLIPLIQGKNGPELVMGKESSLPSEVELAIDSGDFKGKEGEILSLYVKSKSEKRILLLGLGKREALSVESLRRAYGSAVKRCLSLKLTTINVSVPHLKGISEKEVVTGLTEGLLLPNYAFERYKMQKSEEKNPAVLLEQITLLGCAKEMLEVAETTLTICEGVYYARDLVNGNADEVTPQYLAKCAKGLGHQYPKLKVTVFDKKRIEKEKMGLLLAVNRGSNLDPAMIIIEYKGDPKSKEHLVLIGKGITYDTGGLNIKTANMETMKCDMGGAATCLGTIQTAARLKLKVNLTVVIPTTENSTSSHSYKPGDIYQSYLGMTVEVVNTDAEGRLILADAMAYAVKNLKPTYMIDFATLTGGIDVALGSEATGMMATDDKLANSLIKAGEETQERVWRMPLYEEYRDKLKSDFADIKNWNGRSATSCVAAIFLKEFTGGIPWAHLDIASTAFLSEAKKYIPKQGTGVGVRLMIRFLQDKAV